MHIIHTQHIYIHVYIYIYIYIYIYVCISTRWMERLTDSPRIFPARCPFLRRKQTDSDNETDTLAHKQSRFTKLLVC